MPTSRTQQGVIVGVDGSAPSKVAVDWAAREAAMRAVPLTLVHVVPPFHDWMSPEVHILDELRELRQRDGRQFLSAARQTAEAATKPDSAEVSGEIYTGNILSTLVDLSKAAELVVVGCRGRGVIGRRLVGSVSARLVRHARCPVAIIHDEDPLMPHPYEAPVVVGIDGSPASESATAIAIDEASRRGVQLIAVHAWSDFSAYELPGLKRSEFEEQANETLAARLAGWQERYPDVDVRRVVVCDRPAHQLLEQSESAQLTVVGSHGRGGFAGMLLGSVSSAVVESARMPVMVTRPV